MNSSSAFVLAAVGGLLCSLSACGGDDDVGAPTSPTVDAAAPPAPLCAQTPPPDKPAASCEVSVERPPLAAVKHVPEGTNIAYCSNPPSSGEHYPIWAAFQEYSAEIAWPYLVHSMEHGAVVLLYKCDPPGCPDVVEALRKVRDAAAVDPLCSGQATPRRIILLPSTTIATRVAATAWGATYQAACVDPPTLDAFIRDNYAKGPENFCNPGRVF